LKKLIKNRLIIISLFVLVLSILVFFFIIINPIIRNRIRVSLDSFRSNKLSVENKLPELFLDKTLPKISIVSPDKEVFTKTSMLKITVSDENLNTEVTINNRIANTDNNGYLEYPFDVVEGKNVFEIVAKDTFDNKSTQVLELNLTIGVPQRVPILMYHHIDGNLVEGNSVHEKLFGEQLDWLIANGFNTISFSQLNDYLIYGFALPEKPILLSFDDGYVDNYYNAFKIMVNKGMKGSFGIITDLVGTDANGRRFYMSWDELREMDLEGMELVAHSMSHKYMPKISDKELEQEMLESKKILEKFTNKKIETFVYPTGGFNDHVIGKLKEYGYRSARISGDYKKMSIENLYKLPVIKVAWGTTPEQLDKLIQKL